MVMMLETVMLFELLGTRTLGVRLLTGVRELIAQCLSWTSLPHPSNHCTQKSSLFMKIVSLPFTSSPTGPGPCPACLPLELPDTHLLPHCV